MFIIVGLMLSNCICPSKGILYGTMTLELGGKVTIECEKTKCFTELEFKLKVYFFNGLYPDHQQLILR